METDLFKVVEDYQNNLRGLRELLKLPEKFEKKAKEITKRHDIIMLPPLIKFLQDRIKLLKSKDQKEKIDKFEKTLKEVIKRYGDLCPENIDKNGKLKISIGKTYFKSFPSQKLFQEREKLDESLLHKIHIERAVLFNLICYLEKVLSDVAHLILKAHPEVLCLDVKQITFSDLTKFSTLEEVREDLVNEEIEKLLFGSISKFFDFFEKIVFRSEIPNFAEFKNEVIEVKERRNLLVHNGGIINQKYLNTVNERLIREYKSTKGEQVALDKNYLLNAIKVFELVGIELIVLAGLKFKVGQKDSNMGDQAISIVYENIKSKNYFLAEKLSVFLSDKICLKYLIEVQRDYCKLNYWLTLKRQGKLDLKNEELIKYDVSSKSSLIKMCYFTLIGEFLEAEKCILPSFNSEAWFTPDAYEDFPILGELRKQKTAKKIVENYIKEASLKKDRNHQKLKKETTGKYKEKLIPAGS